MARIGQDVGVRSGKVTGQVSSIKEFGKFGSAVLAIGAKVLVQLVKGGELGV